MPYRLKDIRVGTKADIETHAPTGAQENLLFPTVVEATNDTNGEIRMVAPLELLSGHRIKSGEHFRLYLQMSGSLYQITCVATGYERSNATIVLVAKKAENSEIENANRRNDYRVNTFVDVFLQRYSRDSDGKYDIVPIAEQIKTITCDISTGGMGALTKMQLFKDEPVKCTLVLEKEDVKGRVTFKGRVVRSIQRDPSEAYPFAAGIKIEEISKTDAALLMRYSLACQREALRNRSDKP